MSSLSAPGSVAVEVSTKNRNLTVKIVLFTAMLAVAMTFVGKYVFRYYLHYNEAAFTDPARGAANYWALRGWLLMHISGGMVALLAGPWQFWTGFRMKFANIHRWTGRIFLCGVAVGSIGALRLIIDTTFGWGFGLSLFGVVLAWLTTTGMAYYAISSGNVTVHKEWMVRAYVVTFAFVTFRVFNDYGPTSRLQPDSDRAITIGWASWALPLLVAEVILQMRQMRTVSRPA